MIRRTRLTTQMSATPNTNWLVLAGAGYGKSTLLHDLQSGPRPFVVVAPQQERVDLDVLVKELVAVVDRNTPARLAADLSEVKGEADATARLIAEAIVGADCSVAFDDVHTWTDTAGEFRDFILTMASRLATSASAVVIAGRVLPGFLRSLRPDPRWRALDEHDLALSRDEVADFLSASGVAQTIHDIVHERTAGWPTAVATLATRLQTSASVPATELARYEALVDGFLHRQLEQLNTADMTSARTLALLPFFDGDLATLLGDSELIERLMAAGLPTDQHSDGWIHLPEQFRSSVLRIPGPSVSGTFDSAITGHFIRRGEIQAAITACLAIGDNAGAARIVANASYSQETQFDPVALNAAMTTIGESADQVPRSLLVQAQVNVSNGAFDEGLRCIERAEAVATAPGSDPADPVHLEILLELGVWRHFSGRSVEARQLLDRCQGVIDAERETDTDSFLANRARLLDLRGLLSMSEGTMESLETARVSMTESLAIWRRLQEPRAATATALRLVSDVLIDLGRRQEALTLLDSLASIGPMTLVNRARVQLQRARLLPYLDRSEDVAEALADARAIGAEGNHDWLLAMADGHECVAASIVGDCTRVAELRDELIANADRFITSGDEGLTWCLVAEAFMRCGDIASAAEALAKARGCDGLHQPTYEFTHAALQAYSGDPDKAASSIEQLVVDGVLPERRWALSLLQSLCAFRQGDLDNADKYLQASLDEAATLGHRSLPVIAERRLVGQLREATAGRSVVNEPDASPLPSSSSGAIDIRIYNEFAVTADGVPINLPGGQISDLIKLLVLNNGRLVVDQVVDFLWPDTDLHVGRPRLRNVLKRLRKSCEHLVERSGDALALGAIVDSDHARALTVAEAALRADTSLPMIDHAIALNCPPLLSDDRYAEWAEDARRLQQRRLLKLWDKQADLAEKAGDIDLAVTALEAAHEADATASSRLTHACTLLRSDGRHVAAEALMSRHQATNSR